MAILIRDAIDDFLLGMEASHASPSTIRQYRIMLRRVAGFAERRDRTRLDQLTVEVVRAAVAAAYGDPEDRDAHGAHWKGGEATAHAMVRALRSFATALRADGLPVADFTVVRLPTVPERIQPRLLPDEFRALEAAVLGRLMGGRRKNPRLLVARDLALLSLLADTGLRASEFCALNLEDLDLDEGTVTVRRGKGSKPRMLSIRDDDPDERDGGPTIRALRDYLEYRGHIAGRSSSVRALWLTRLGTRLRYNALYNLLNTLCDEAGIERRPPHSFRRGYFSAEYRERPTALPVLRARMGWSPKSHNMVDVYTRGADIDLAREQPQPLVSKRWRQGGSKNPSRTGPAAARRKAAQLGYKADPSAESTPDVAALITAALRQDPELLRSAIAMALRPEDGTAKSGVA